MVHQRPGNPPEIVLSALGHAGAGAGGVGHVTAAAGVGSGDEKQFAGIAHMGIGACDDDLAGLDRLAQGFEDRT